MVLYICIYMYMFSGGPRLKCHGNLAYPSQRLLFTCDCSGSAKCSFIYILNVLYTERFTKHDHSFFSSIMQLFKIRFLNIPQDQIFKFLRLEILTYVFQTRTIKHILISKKPLDQILNYVPYINIFRIMIHLIVYS